LAETRIRWQPHKEITPSTTQGLQGTHQGQAPLHTRLNAELMRDEACEFNLKPRRVHIGAGKRQIRGISADPHIAPLSECLEPLRLRQCRSCAEGKVSQHEERASHQSNSPKMVSVPPKGTFLSYCSLVSLPTR